jgi:hypothetical protein
MRCRRARQRYLAGHCAHRLLRTLEGFRVQGQRVDLLSYDAPIEFVLQFWL